MTRRRAFVLALSLAASSGGAAETTLAGRPLHEAISMLSGQGLRIVYSDELVRDDMRVLREPERGSPRDRLAAILAPHGLAVAKGPRNSVVIVKAAPPPAEKGVEKESERRYREQVVVKAQDRSEPEAIGRVDVAPQVVAAAAGGGEDVFRVLQKLPGVTATDELSGRLSVRGGGPDENLTILDGVELHNPYRLMTLFGAFNPETIDGFEFRPGGFGARYGDRLSSVLVAETRDGTRDRKLAGSAGLSMLDANVVAEGWLGARRGSWLIGARRTYYDLIAEPLTRQGPSDGENRDIAFPSFQDLHAKVAWDAGRGHKLSLLALLSHEDADASDDRGSPDDYSKILHRVRGHLVSLTHAVTVSSKMSARTVLSAYQDNNRFVVDAQWPDFREVPPHIVVDFDHRYSVLDWALRHESTAQLSSRHTLSGGVEAHRLSTSLAWRLAGTRAAGHGHGTTSLFRFQSWDLPGDLPPELDSGDKAFRAGAWVEDRVQITGTLAAQLAARVDYNDVGGEALVSPRVSATWSVAPDTRLHVSAGAYSQSPGHEKTPMFDRMLDLGLARSVGLRSQRAWHILAGLECDLGPGAVFRIEAYDKRFDRMWTGALETESERAARVAAYDFPRSLQESVPAAALVTVRPTNDARGHARGFDLFLERKPSSNARLHGWISYAYGKADREAHGVHYPADYDLRHAFNLVGVFRARRWLSLSASGRLASGLPFTGAAGARIKAEPDLDDRDGDGNRTELVPYRSPQGHVVYETWLGGVENLNRARHRDFQRVDVRTTFHIKKRVDLYVDVINVFNRRNPGWPISSVVPRNGQPAARDRDNDAHFPILPTLGVHVRF